ncbi:NAD(P)-dependent oxidoreductase [Diaphorobacter sp. HDW4A]|uniref:NAD(P)-dependent oxidoreductase n=1 Tax=Diaphorobacter sp. HDW4A TaxID=2714924 RepID=UPI00140ACEF3|nr:NAD(P)-dependent oxidoreductase [Diaphorobacter sp. HDW4A]QIL80108.1 NAD(P)-dependent oxidoreductase [Diaphorobacter sp. HDW4A]
MNIGFIGLGRMGFSLARSLLKNQQRLTVFDLNADAAQKLEAEGAIVAKDVASLCQGCDLVFTMLPGPKQVKQVALGEGGVIQNLRPGAIYIDMSTIDVDTVDLLNEAFSSKGFVFGDAPVGRLAMHADRGESLFMLGIDEKQLSTIEPVLYKMGTTIHHCGKAGSGTRTKIINNMMVLCYCQINSEALVLAKSLGLDVSKTLDVLVNTTASNGQLKEKWPKKVLAGDLTPGFDLALGYKDISLASSAGAATQVALPVCDTAKNVFRMALAAGKAGQDTSCLTDFWAEANGIEKIRL